MPEVLFHPLDDGAPGWGQVALWPWDADIFGFPVAAWQPRDPRTIVDGREAFRRRFQAWASAHRVELISCIVGAGDRIWRALLPELGFCVEQTLDLTFRVQVTLEGCVARYRRFYALVASGSAGAVGEALAPIAP